MPVEPRLTSKMIAMIDHYINSPDRSKTASYRHAYETEGLAHHTYHSLATKAFQHPLVVAEIERADEERLRVARVNSTAMLDRLWLLANFNIKKFIKVQDNGLPVYDFTNATDEDWYCIHELTTETWKREDGEHVYDIHKVKIKTESKLKALELVGRCSQIDSFREITRDGNKTLDAMADVMSKLADKLPV